MSESLLFTRLLETVVKQLGGNFIADLSKLTVVVVEFVETHAKYLIPNPSGREKLELALNWIEQLIKSKGGSLEVEIKNLIAGFIGRIVEATKGQVFINDAFKTVQQLVGVPTPVPSGLPADENPSPQASSCFGTSAPTPKPKPLKRGFTLKKG